MAERTPASVGDTGYCPTRSVFTGLVAGGAAVSTNGKIQPHLGMALDVYYFPDVDDGDTWDSGITTIECIAWQGDDLTGDNGAAGVTTRAGLVTFSTPAAGGQKGWLWVLRRR